jgi:spermidine dehydrogenase
MGWEKKVFDTSSLKIEEQYDLVVVGAASAACPAAWFYRQQHPTARVLIIENHDDFGGHAKRNEFQAGSQMIPATAAAKPSSRPSTFTALR